jgi:RNA polymerase sigma factor (sigma-70 family)
VKPENVQRFFGLASEQVRRVLIDLARKYLGSGKVQVEPVIFLGGSRSRSHHRLLEKQADAEGEPANLLEWSEFHDRVERLPEAEQEVFALIFYQGMTQVEAAQVLQISLRTIKRRWRDAQILLYQSLHESWPAT